MANGPSIRRVEPSQRGRATAPFHALAFGERAAALERSGVHVVRLSIGEPDFGAPPAVRAALADTMDGRPLPYTAPTGLAELRAAIAGFYRDRHGADVDPSRVVVTSGASAALLLVTAAITDPGDEVIVADPSYPCNREMIATFGAIARAVPTTAATRYQLDRDGIAAAWSKATRAVMLASPSNPTGTSIPADELAAITGLAADRGAWRVMDEIYLALADGDGGQARRSVLAIDPEAVVVNSFSKYFGMTGWRLGWCIVPEHLVDPVERLAMHYFLCASAPAQQAALACFTPATLALCEQRRRELVERRRTVLDGLAAIGVDVPVPPDGAFYVYVDVSTTGLDSWTFCERALDEAHVALTPGRDFGTHTAATHVRLSYASSPDQITEGLHRLGEFVAGL